jgi:hydroxypyruvate isomerase
VPRFVADLSMMFNEAPLRNEPDGGEACYPYRFRVIDEIGCQGWVGCEYRSAGMTTECMTWLLRAT